MVKKEAILSALRGWYGGVEAFARKEGVTKQTVYNRLHRMRDAEMIWLSDAMGFPTVEEWSKALSQADALFKGRC